MSAKEENTVSKNFIYSFRFFSLDLENIER